MSTDYPALNNDPNPQKILKLYENRLRQFTNGGGDYHDIQLPKFYDRARSDSTADIKLQVYSVPHLERPRFKEAMKKANWRVAKKGEWFGPSWSTHWFKIEIKVPKSWKKAEQVIWNWDSSDEGFLFDEHGHAVVGLSGQERKEWIVPEEWRDDKWHTFYIETSCNMMTGDGSPPDMNKYFRLNVADLVWPNLEARALNIDYWILTDAAREFPGNTWQKHRARDIGNKIMDKFDPERPDETIAECRKIASQFVGELVNSTDVYKNNNENFVYGLGNCHIDTAWLWPFAETHRKVGRSWASQLNLLERYPEYVFVASQVQQFYWLKEDYPDLFERVKKAVKGGRFIPVGGSWVEHDTNMPGGESMARQFLLGQRFFEAEFGMRTKTFWLPDSFGYSPQVPQFSRLAGMDRFLTQKLSWNNINSFPHSTFNWVALDGSQVVCHMPPNNTYTAPAHFGDVARSLRQHKDLEIDNKGMLLYGHGDGGGGPTAEMLEKLRRCRGVSDTVGELPRVKLGPTVDDFYDKIIKDTNGGKDLYTWVGEMYLEFHRGTYTTQGAIKKGNRYSEALMHDIEWLATLASISNKDYKYPTKEIDEIWQDICLNQFHDVLPGSGIEMIYDDARAIYLSIFKRGKKLLEEALETLGLDFAPSEKSQLVSVNTLPWKRAEVVEVEKTDSAAAQTVGQKKLVRFVAQSNGLAKPETVAVAAENAARVTESKAGVYTLENGHLRVKVEGGVLTSVYDVKADREVLAEGKKGNQFIILDDKPLSFPAWDTELYSLGTRKDVGGGDVTITENGPLRASVQVKQRISSKSSIKTTISLDAFHKDAHSAVKFECEVDWHETYKFLKVEFPVDVHSDTAAYETSYGYHRRPTHYNTSWDVAKFEVCGHRWADLSDFSYGVSLLNDSKYGYSIHGNIMRLSLLRASKSPDAHADMGKHFFKYALFPHSGTLGPATVQAGWNFNQPLKHVHSRVEARPVDEEPEHVLSAVSLKDHSGSLVLATLKRHEDDEDISRGILPVRGGKGKKNIIARVYDSLGGRSRGKLHVAFGIKKAYKVNILEDDIEELKVVDGEYVPIELRPFEIATFRLELA